MRTCTSVKERHAESTTNELAGMLMQPAAISEPFGGMVANAGGRQMAERRGKYEVPIWEKSNLTLEEAAAYSGIGIAKLRQISEGRDCDFVLWNGTKRLLKRKRLDAFLDREFSI